MAHNESTRFEWDETKNHANQRKHGVSFEEASELLRSDDYLEIFDDVHSEHEDRFIAIGQIEGRVVTVVWTEREEDTIRIISARLATSRESRAFRRQEENR